MDVTLTYSGGTRDFRIYSANAHPISIFRTYHVGLSGRLSEQFPGSYRHLIDVEFAPIGYDKTAIAFLWGYMFGSARQIIIGGNSYNPVTVVGSSLAFDFQGGTFFGDSFSIQFEESMWSGMSDTGSTRILKPLYTPSGEGISGETLSIYCNLVDDIGIEVVKHDLSFIDSAREDVAFAYRHVIAIDTGPISRPTFEAWINDFVQWQHKQIDTTMIDPAHGTVYDVAFDGDGIDWQLSEGVLDIVTARLVFKEITPRTALEDFSGPPIWDEFVTDTKVTE